MSLYRDTPEAIYRYIFTLYRGNSSVHTLRPLKLRHPTNKDTLIIRTLIHCIQNKVITLLCCFTSCLRACFSSLVSPLCLVGIMVVVPTSVTSVCDFSSLNTSRGIPFLLTLIGFWKECNVSNLDCQSYSRFLNKNLQA